MSAYRGQKTWRIVIKNEVRCDVYRSSMIVAMKLKCAAVCHMQTRTHNHTANKEIGSSYLGSGSVDMAYDVVPGAANLVDARANPKNITSYLSDGLGITLSSQQARNIIQRMQSHDSAEAKLRTLLE
ncbi:hypothetical protein PybrP1_003433 [[Pythium] brassicae (nom. inval.)]|nr:hypothetical protein PybrP1_003433 [[Pythium] brassicae (nom. inval.)]